jgi:hypothetical protein
MIIAGALLQKVVQGWGQLAWLGSDCCSTGAIDLIAPIAAMRLGNVARRAELAGRRRGISRDTNASERFLERAS